jgi:hypothetical protein
VNGALDMTELACAWSGPVGAPQKTSGHATASMMVAVRTSFRNVYICLLRSRFLSGHTYSYFGRVAASVIVDTLVSGAIGTVFGTSSTT